MWNRHLTSFDMVRWISLRRIAIIPPIHLVTFAHKSSRDSFHIQTRRMSSAAASNFVCVWWCMTDWRLRSERSRQWRPAELITRRPSHRRRLVEYSKLIRHLITLTTSNCYSRPVCFQLATFIVSSSVNQRTEITNHIRARDAYFTWLYFYGVVLSGQSLY